MWCIAELDQAYIQKLYRSDKLTLTWAQIIDPRYFFQGDKKSEE
jgi:hypothetical protein